MPDPIQGGPGSDAPPAPASGTVAAVTPAGGPAAAAVKVTINGVEHIVSPVTAAALQTERDRMAGLQGRLQQQEARLREIETALAPPPDESAPPEPPKADDLTYAPEKFARDTQRYVDYKAAEGEAQRHAEAERDAAIAARTQSWNAGVAKFYTDHADLVPYEDVVEGVFRKNLGIFRGVEPEAGWTKLAELSKARVAELTKGRAARPTTVEGTRSSPARVAAVAPDEDEGPEEGGLGVLLRERHAAFRAPIFHRGSVGNGRARHAED